MKRPTFCHLRRLLLVSCLGAFALCGVVLMPAVRTVPADETASSAATDQPLPVPGPDVDRAPVDLALAPDEAWLATANQIAHTVSLVRTSDGKLLDEIPCGKRPSAVALCPDGKTLVVSGHFSGDVHILEVVGEKLRRRAVIRTGFDPLGVAVTKDGKKAYVALQSAAKVAVLDLEQGTVRGEIAVGHWPRHLALSPDDARLAVGCSGDRGIAVVDTAAGKMEYLEECSAINIGHLKTSSDGKYVYFPWMIYRQNPINPANIRQGWVLASRIARVKLDGPARREAISLDVPGKAMSDPYGLDISPDEQRMVATSSGTHELLVYRLPDLPLVAVGGPGDLIDPALARNRDRFDRIELGGRPMGLRFGRDGRTVYVANYLANAVQVVDIAEKKVLRALALGGPAEPSLARKGEALFYDARLSLDQWYSCHSCHYEGGTNAVTMDTLNDGTVRTFKTVLPLHGLTETGPWTWHGWQKDLRAAMVKSITSTMQGKEPKPEEVDALIEYFKSLELPPNPYRRPDGTLSEAAQRGQKVFQSSKAGCATCHNGPHYTDGQIHDVGLGSPSDVYKGYNTPSLAGVYRRLRLLHHGRAKSLEEVLTDLHDPAKVTGQGALTDDERRDLIEYLKSL